MAIQRFDNCAGTLVTESGSWIPVVDSGTINLKVGHISSEFISATGRRSVFLRGNNPRTWEVSGICRAEQAKSLTLLASMKPERMYWLSPLGRFVNMLDSHTPIYGQRLGISTVDDVPVELYSVNDTGNNVSRDAPVKPGMRLTFAAYMTGGFLRAWWKDSAGKLLDGVPVSQSAGGPTLGLVEVTAEAPPGAAYATIAALRCRNFGNPSIRIASSEVRFTSGASSCAWVTLHDVEVSHSSIGGPGAIFDVNFTLREVS